MNFAPRRKKGGIDIFVKQYLKRIGYEGEPKADLATLSELQHGHLMSVPYENLDILRNIPLSLDTDDLFDKIVARKRGGYCFELNALFCRLLDEIGFKTANFFARFLFGEQKVPMRRHRVMGVDIKGELYLADVGVGSISPEYPLKIAEGETTEIRGLSYMFSRDEFLGWVLCVKINGEWKRLFSFSEDRQFEVDFVQPNFYCQHSPDSVFNKTNMVAMRTIEGKYSIDGDIFKIFDWKTRQTKETKCADAEIPGILKKYFGIEGI